MHRAKDESMAAYTEYFASDFRVELEAALSVRPDFAAAACWRQACAWDRVADLTLEGYRRALGDQECAE